jgi:hypothetical protein
VRLFARCQTKAAGSIFLVRFGWMGDPYYPTAKDYPTAKAALKMNYLNFTRRMAIILASSRFVFMACPEFSPESITDGQRTP